MALESQDVFGWRVSWCCFNSNSDNDLHPEERIEASPFIPSLTIRLYLTNCFHSQFLQVWHKAIQFFSPLLLLFSTAVPIFFTDFSFSLKQKTSTAFTLYTPILTPLASLSCSWKQRKVKISEYWICEYFLDSLSQDRLIQRWSSKPKLEFAIKCQSAKKSQLYSHDYSTSVQCIVEAVDTHSKKAGAENPSLRCIHHKRSYFRLPFNWCH